MFNLSVIDGENHFSTLQFGQQVDTKSRYMDLYYLTMFCTPYFTFRTANWVLMRVIIERFHFSTAFSFTVHVAVLVQKSYMCSFM